MDQFIQLNQLSNKKQNYRCLGIYKMDKINRKFVDELFQCEYFCDRLREYKQVKEEEQKYVTFGVSLMDEVINDIVDTLAKSMSQQFDSLVQSNTQLYDQIQRIKLMLSSPANHYVPLIMTTSQINPPIIASSPSPMKQQNIKTQIFFHQDLQMKQVCNTIRTLQSQILQANHSLAQSFSIEDDSICDEQKQEFQFQIECKVYEKFKTIEQKINKMFSTYGIQIEQRIQQLKKTITSVVEAMNDPQYWVNKSEIKQMKKGDTIKMERKNADFLPARNINDIVSKKPYEPANKQNVSSNLNNQKLITDLNQSLNIISNQKKFSTSSTGKTISSLNKSINFGRTKIKSLFGFGTQKKQQNNQQLFIN